MSAGPRPLPSPTCAKTHTLLRLPPPPPPPPPPPLALQPCSAANYVRVAGRSICLNACWINSVVQAVHGSPALLAFFKGIELPRDPKPWNPKQGVIGALQHKLQDLNQPAGRL
jgi:hypothetical protein